MNTDSVLARSSTFRILSFFYKKKGSLLAINFLHPELKKKPESLAGKTLPEALNSRVRINLSHSKGNRFTVGILDFSLSETCVGCAILGVQYWHRAGCPVSHPQDAKGILGLYI